MIEFLCGLSPDTIFLALATIIGPVVAVLLTLFVQRKMKSRYQMAQHDFLRSLEKDGQESQMKRTNSKGTYDNAWNVAIRDLAKEI